MLAAALPLSADARVSETRLQRTRGRLKLEFVARDAETVAHSLYQEGALKARMLASQASGAEGVIINTAGGLTGGDEVEIAVTAGARTHVTLSGQACEKIYRSPGNDSRIQAELQIDSGARLEWLAQPTILFNRACLHRTTTVAIADDAQFLGIEALVFGRTAMGEKMRSGRVFDGWKVSRGRQLIYADTFRLDGEIEAALERPFLLAGNGAVASLIYVAPDAEAKLPPMQELLADMPHAGVSAWNGFLVARIVAPDGYELGRNLAYVLAALRDRALPRTWII